MRRKKSGAEPLGELLGRLYRSYAKAEFVNPDPLGFLREYDKPADREIAALAASSLAYGRVAQILKSVRAVLDILGSSPRDFVENTPRGAMRRFFSGFRHRFTDGDDLADLFAGAGKAVRESGSLENAFLEGYEDSQENVLPALAGFSRKLCVFFEKGESYLLPSPARGSACKRLNLMLRWLVRDSDIDPGAWTKVPKSKLVVPLDTHMFRIAKELGICTRSSPDLKAAIEITRAFAAVCPDDPVKFDFPLTRFGIHPMLNGKKPTDENVRA